MADGVLREDQTGMRAAQAWRGLRGLLEAQPPSSEPCSPAQAWPADLAAVHTGVSEGQTLVHVCVRRAPFQKKKKMPGPHLASPGSQTPQVLVHTSQEHSLEAARSRGPLWPACYRCGKGGQGWDVAPGPAICFNYRQICHIRTPTGQSCAAFGQHGPEPA